MPAKINTEDRSKIDMVNDVIVNISIYNVLICNMHVMCIYIYIIGITVYDMPEVTTISLSLRPQRSLSRLGLTDTTSVFGRELGKGVSQCPNMQRTPAHDR